MTEAVDAVDDSRDVGAASERERLRLTFGADAERYDRARPGYPGELFDDLAKLAGIGPGRRVLGIGGGTGQATIPLAQRGCQLVCMELSAELAAVAGYNLAAFPDVSFVVAAFEDWPLPSQSFDTVVSATAFHWIDPSMRVTKAAEALVPGGSLATIYSHHVAGGSADFFAEVQTCYERWDPAMVTGLRVPPADEIPSDSEELDASERFGPAMFRRYEWEVPYSTAAYRDLLLTYSGHIDLVSPAREGLLDCITSLMESRYGSQINKRYLTELRIAQTRR